MFNKFSRDFVIRVKKTKLNLHELHYMYIAFFGFLQKIFLSRGQHVVTYEPLSDFAYILNLTGCGAAE